MVAPGGRRRRLGAPGGGSRALWGVNEIITTLLLNYVAILAVAYLVTGPWRERDHEPQLPGHRPLPRGAVLPLGSASGLHIGVFFPLVIAAVLLVLLQRSRWGFEVRMIGASPDAARVAGHVDRPEHPRRACSWPGRSPASPGMIEVSTTFGRLRQGISPGLRLHGDRDRGACRSEPRGTLVVAFLFGGFIVGGLALQTQGVPQAFVLLLQGIILFCALAGSSSPASPHARMPAGCAAGRGPTG